MYLSYNFPHNVGTFTKEKKRPLEESTEKIFFFQFIQTCSRSFSYFPVYSTS